MNILRGVAEVMRLGAKKYGLRNWRKQPIRASTYYDAMFRHLTDWYESLENTDAESGQHHLDHVIACALLARDGMVKCSFIDDRDNAEVLHSTVPKETSHDRVAQDEVAKGVLAEDARARMVQEAHAANEERRALAADWRAVQGTVLGKLEKELRS